MSSDEVLDETLSPVEETHSDATPSESAGIGDKGNTEVERTGESEKVAEAEAVIGADSEAEAGAVSAGVGKRSGSGAIAGAGANGSDEESESRHRVPAVDYQAETATAEHEIGESTLYRISYRIAQAWFTRPYERKPDEPVHRRLQIYSTNPGTSPLDGGVAICRVPYEPLKSGPTGAVMEVCNSGPDGESWGMADLEDPHVIMRDGYKPSLSDPRFHQQMVYAVAMATYEKFRKALGRQVAWPFLCCRDDGDGERNRLRLRPHGACEPNAWYNRARGEITFGYFKAKHSTPVVEKGVGHVFTSLSHDVIAHETSHALLDGLRAQFMIPSHPDVLAFHEAFADLVAVFQHFTIRDIVQRALRDSRGDLQKASILVDIAQEFGRGINSSGQALRTLVDLPDEVSTEDGGRSRNRILQYKDAGKAPHQLGRVLARAVFSAFMTVYEKRTRRYVKLATQGSGVLDQGDIPEALLDILVEETSRTADQFLRICIRAIDYCPPVDLRFGDYLRALITADFDVVPDDSLGYRDAIIKAFGQRGIFGEGTTAMTEDALLWCAPTRTMAPLDELSFCSMEFDGDPAKPVSVSEMRRQAGALGRLVNKPGLDREFGLICPSNPLFRPEQHDLPLIESIRSARRVGVDHEVHFDTVAEVIQRRQVTLQDGRSFSFFGGSTVILGPRGDVRYIIRKRIDSELYPIPEGPRTEKAMFQEPDLDMAPASRLRQQIDYMTNGSENLWVQAGTHLIPRQDLERCLCKTET